MVLIDGATEAVKAEIDKNTKKKQASRFFGSLLTPLAVLVVQPVTSSVVKGISGIAVRRIGRGCNDMVKSF